VLERFASRVRGGGSLGRPRFVAIARWHGGQVVREAKALVPSAWDWAHHAAAPKSRFLDLARGPSRSPDPFLDVKAKFIVRRIAPDSRKVDLHDNPGPALHADLLRAMGFDLGAIHAWARRSSPIRRASPSWTAWRGLRPHDNRISRETGDRRDVANEIVIKLCAICLSEYNRVSKSLLSATPDHPDRPALCRNRGLEAASRYSRTRGRLDQKIVATVAVGYSDCRRFRAERREVALPPGVTWVGVGVGLGRAAHDDGNAGLRPLAPIPGLSSICRSANSTLPEKRQIGSQAFSGGMRGSRRVAGRPIL
jgi:hypothetical protein